ncbi:hypothetical protein [Streptomyces sp. CBMA156]|uniref:hypothetical protein n=2 Tax=Streptomyces sp. CBMA156 TaxID=1930280 RepID=UPI00294FF602|nr:hypothetical protein [Streptomyces sp. CBMA156]
MTRGHDRRAAAPWDRHHGYDDEPDQPVRLPAGVSVPDLRRLVRARAPLGAEHLQARHELDLAATLIIAQPEAADSLKALTNNRQRIHPGGALVLAALLHLTGHDDGCQFWLQFAAGGGSTTAASCLSFLHASRGEFRDSDYWRNQADQLAAEPLDPAAPAAPWPGRTLPAAVWADTLAACHEGLTLRLPARVAAVVHQLPVHSDDEDHGEIPQPSPTLADDLAHASGHARPV